MSIIVNHLSYIYSRDTAYEKQALRDISFQVENGEFIGLLGSTGSGKSTLVQHLNGLLTPSSGSVYYDGEDIFEKDYDRKTLRGKVGLVFQYPEHQLFEVDVFTDVCFGPKNLGLSQSECELRAYEALKLVGFSDEDFYVSPFDLSGGEKRKAAIAGVLAMHPEVLILDEPTAGLDPRGREEILSLIRRVREETGLTVILVSHSMDDVAENTERLLVMNKGELLFDDTPRNVFQNYETLVSIGLDIPQATTVLWGLRKKGFPVSTDAITLKEAREEILRLSGLAIPETGGRLS
ncbi:MAG: energy-coupling factor transporter ATPase [Lachnospiraceae bacterium]|nr:energy-coupling factor transporter ATPase [Lachnospiraceae bacterium]